jgi:hypothetical protein
VAVVAHFRFPGESIENYDRGIARGGTDVTDQPDRLFHVAFATDDGWAVIDVWESAEAFERFREYMDLPPDRQPHVYEVHNLIARAH